MKPYGFRGQDDIEKFGVQTQFAKLRNDDRRRSRRLMHKQARNDAKRMIRRWNETKA